MEQQKFDNMVQVLSYFADQCDMFKPMLDGVNQLQAENISLKKEVDSNKITNDRIQLNSTFSADYANFGVATVKNATVDNTNTVKVSSKDDLYNLIKAVINVGRENYVRADMEYKLDFYSMTERITFDQYVELWDLITAQHNTPVVDPQPPTESTDPNPTEPVEAETTKNSN